MLRGDTIAFHTHLLAGIWSGVIGGILLGFLSDTYGIWNMMIPVSGGMAITLFTMYGVSVYFWIITVALCWLLYLNGSQGPKSFVAYSIFYGFFSGACRYISTRICSLCWAHCDPGLSLMITGFSSLATGWRRWGELFFNPSVYLNKLCWELFSVYVSTRVGLVLTVGSIFALLSFVIQDALVGTRFNWATPSVFSGVSLFFYASSLWAHCLMISPLYIIVCIFGYHRARISVEN